MRRLSLGFLVAGAVLSALAPRDAEAAVNCNAVSGVPPVARAESLADPVGDVLLICTADAASPPTAAGTPIPQATLTLFLNTTVTSRLLGGEFNEALLLLDEPGSVGNPLRAPCRSVTGICANVGNGQGRAATGAPDYYAGQGAGVNVNVFQGKRTGVNRVDWTFPLDPPSSGQQRVIRLTNLRGNSSALGSPPAQLVAFVSLTSPFPGAVSNPQQIVGFTSQGFALGVRDAASQSTLNAPVEVRQCEITSPRRIATLRAGEGFANAMRRRMLSTSPSDPAAEAPQVSLGQAPTTESMLFDPDMVGNDARGDLGTAGRADHGTRLSARFTNVPAGVRLFVDAEPSAGGALARLTGAESGPFAEVAGSPAGPPGTAEVSLAGGAGTATWEVLAADPAALETLNIGVFALAGPAPPGGETGSVQLAPAPAGTSVASTGPVPGFNPAAGDVPRQLLRASACPPPPPGPAPAAAPASQRATALRKCRKKFPGKAKAKKRKKCIRRAKRLPV